MPLLTCVPVLAYGAATSVCYSYSKDSQICASIGVLAGLFGQSRAGASDRSTVSKLTPRSFRPALASAWETDGARSSVRRASRSGTLAALLSIDAAQRGSSARCRMTAQRSNTPAGPNGVRPSAISPLDLTTPGARSIAAAMSAASCVQSPVSFDVPSGATATSSVQLFLICRLEATVLAGRGRENQLRRRQVLPHSHRGISQTQTVTARFIYPCVP